MVLHEDEILMASRQPTPYTLIKVLLSAEPTAETGSPRLEPRVQYSLNDSAIHGTVQQHLANIHELVHKLLLTR